MSNLETKNGVTVNNVNTCHKCRFNYFIMSSRFPAGRRKTWQKATKPQTFFSSIISLILILSAVNTKWVYPPSGHLVPWCCFTFHCGLLKQFAQRFEPIGISWYKLQPQPALRAVYYGWWIHTSLIYLAVSLLHRPEIMSMHYREWKPFVFLLLNHTIQTHVAVRESTLSFTYP